ncbi:3-methyl-2-oxobutanoate hydroxymethyltransferase [Bordetella tumbae]
MSAYGTLESLSVLTITSRAMTTSDKKETPAAGTETAAPYGIQSRSADVPKRKKVTTVRLADMRRQGEKIAMLTAYDATFAAIEDAAGVDCILVGDSLGMVCQGKTSTVGVSLDEMVYHTRCVAKGLEKADGAALLVADLPFGSYHQSRDQAMASSVRLMEAGAQMIKLEGGDWTTEVVQFLVERGVPVCGHLGLTPQTVSALGGFRVQGKDDDGAAKLMRDAKALEAAGASLLVLEMIPAKLAADLTSQMQTCATIGIGAGSGTAGQVLVMHDMLGINIGRMPKFVRNFMSDTDSVLAAFSAYVQAVKDGTFPEDARHSW